MVLLVQMYNKKKGAAATAMVQQNELQALREKLDIIRQIQQLQQDIGLAPPPTRTPYRRI